MQYCDKCGGPLRFGRGFTVAGCRLCWLEVWTSQEVRWDDDEERGFSAEGESLNSVLLWMTRDAITYGEVTVDFLNSTADSPATSTWLPDGAFEPITAQHRGTPPANPEAWRLRHWLSSTAHRDVNPLQTRQTNNGRRVFLHHYSAQPPHPWAITHHGVTVE